jgi:hypothetical protein
MIYGLIESFQKLLKNQKQPGRGALNSKYLKSDRAYQNPGRNEKIAKLFHLKIK